MFSLEDLLEKRLDIAERTALFKQFDSDNQFIKSVLRLAIEEDKSNKFLLFWYLDNYFYQNEEAFLNWKSAWIEALRQVQYYGSKRSILRILAKKKRPYNEEEAGLLIDFSINHLEDRFETVAVHASCMRLLEQFIPTYPELGAHIKLIIAEHVDATVAFRARAKALLRVVERVSRASKH
ncbi:MAG: hypothetical protein ACPGEC_00550 [Flavobacteriales bacterium]